MTARPLTVLIVSEDRKVLRHLSQFFHVFGYSVHQAATVQQAWTATEPVMPDFLIVDADLPGQGALEICRRLGDRDAREYIFKFLMHQPSAALDLTEALQAGVDDFLTKPVIHGELLFRLRAGARSLENERRFRQQFGRDSVTGCAGRGELHRQWAEATTARGKTRQTCGIVVVDIDFFDRVNHLYGWAVGDRVLGEVAQRIEGRLETNMQLARWDADRFCVVASGKTCDQAAEWAESVRKSVCATPVESGAAELQITTSFGVAAAVAEGPAAFDNTFRDASSALHAAKRSGRNCVVRWGEFDDEAREWKELAAPGKLFQNTLARDVMTPCTVVVHPDDTAQYGRTLLAHTRLTAIPVVDRQGKFLGVIMPQVDETIEAETVEQLMLEDIPTFDEETDFASLMEFCSREAAWTLMILKNGRPTGSVSPAQLAALTEPLTIESFAPSCPQGPTSSYLVVPDDLPEDQLDLASATS